MLKRGVMDTQQAPTIQAAAVVEQEAVEVQQEQVAAVLEALDRSTITEQEQMKREQEAVEEQEEMELVALEVLEALVAVELEQGEETTTLELLGQIILAVAVVELLMVIQQNTGTILELVVLELW
jgi:hypothetical protein